MAPTVHFVRHAQGFHNLCFPNQRMHDPSLTTLGEEQCRKLAQDFPYHESVDLVVASPLRRTIYTALIGFEPEFRRGLTLVTLPEAQEIAELPCDTGSDVQLLEQEFRNEPVDFSLVTEGWTSKRGKWAAHSRAVEKRAQEVRKWLKARPEKNIVLVTHGGFLHYLTEDWADSGKFNGLSETWNEPVGKLIRRAETGTGWANTEFRSYDFVDEAGDNASIKETAASREWRKGAEHPMSMQEQQELKAVKHKYWEASGYLVSSKV